MRVWNGANQMVNFVYGQNSLYRRTASNYCIFSNQKFNLQHVEIQDATPKYTSNIVRFYHNTVAALGFTEKMDGINSEDFENNRFSWFSIYHQQKRLFLKLTGLNLTFKLYFFFALEEAIDVCSTGERFSQRSIDSARSISENALIDGWKH